MSSVDTAPSTAALFAYVGVCVVLVFVWLAEQGFFLYRYTQSTKGGEKAPGPVLVLWGASAAFVFTGLQIIRPSLLDGAPDGPFSTRLLWDKAMASGRMFAAIHDGPWMHVGDPQAREQAEARLARAA